MIRFALPLLFLGSFTFAAEVAYPGGGAHAQHAKKHVDEEATNIACVGEQSVKGYAASSDVENMTRHPAEVKPLIGPNGEKLNAKDGYSMNAVFSNLAANHFLLDKPDKMDIDSYYDDESASPKNTSAIPGTMPVPRKAKDAGPWLYNNAFVNLLDCPRWKKIMLDSKNIPKGAVVVYSDGHSGKIEIRTPSGYWSDTPRTDDGFAKGLKVIGVYVKPSY